jgi:hypothetical protein
VENSTAEEESNEAIIHLSGKDVSILEMVQNEIELHEKIY